nr:hypothetical protein [uncultured Cohaesibacter sp.]
MADLSSDDILDAVDSVVASLVSGDFPVLHRNETLDDALAALDGGEKAYLNMVDGDLRTSGEALGGGGYYELEQEALFELTVKAGSEAQSRSALGRIIQALAAVIEAANADGGALAALGALAAPTGLQRDNLATSGVPGIKGAVVTVTVSFTSDQPF